ncbi:16106_t:CDS:2 [Entrophospora sp. SA101]|nr:16106_t:CDS:2 [Entrophospora sp. SA101]
MLFNTIRLSYLPPQRLRLILAINNDIRDDKNNPEYLIAKQKFDESTECWICKKPLDVCESVGRSVNAHQITVIAETFERYKMMKVGQMKYIDSMQFMNSSLAKLADNLGAVKCKDTDCNHYHRIDKDRCIGTLANHKITKQYYEKIGYSPEQIALVCSKGELPYDYIDSDDRFNETELPPIEAFAVLNNRKDLQKRYLKMILNTKADSPRGYFLNIKAHFPSKLHDYLNDLPPAVENVAIKKNQLSPYNNKIVEDLDGGRFSEIKKLVTHLVSKPSFKYARQLSNTLIGAHMGQASVVLNKPIIVGASVLGLSKLLMYRFWYGYVKEKYGDKAKLGYMDTDGMIFQTETEDIYKDMAERPDIFDLTDSKTIGLFKDECPGKIITESIHIRAKTYHYVISDKSTKSKHKGVSKGGMNDLAINVNTNTYDQKLGGTLLDDPVPESRIVDPMTLIYRDCLFENEVFHAKNIGFRSKNHVLSLVESEKKALCPLNSKNWVLSDGITPWAYGHWRIDAYKSMVKAGISPEMAEKRAIVAQHHPTLENKYMVNPKLL